MATWARTGDSGIANPQRALSSWVCQHCGLHVRLGPWRARFAIHALVLPLPVVLTGVAFLAVSEGPGLGWVVAACAAWFGWTAVAFYLLQPFIEARRNPVVDGAPQVTVRNREIVHPRRCRCGLPASCRSVDELRLVGVPIGTDFEFQCEHCGHRFELVDGNALIVGAACSAILAVFAAVLASSIGWLALVLGALSGGLCLAVAIRARERRRYSEV